MQNKRLKTRIIAAFEEQTVGERWQTSEQLLIGQRGHFVLLFVISLFLSFFSRQFCFPFLRRPYKACHGGFSHVSLSSLPPFLQGHYFMVQDVFSKVDVLSTSGSHGAPNFRQVRGSYPLFGMGQPSLNGFRLLLQKLQAQGHKVSKSPKKTAFCHSTSLTRAASCRTTHSPSHPASRRQTGR